ncbi:MAG: 2-C-methyl-D-erythritol 2,4-cyclodiphosphate synthase [Oscillospiraceae bacterium]|nr:2-C-methyl-D-erythritol 2,4-cyclodiphosphate synthase [Oscillospiraceae bacterium]
MLRIGQGYDVHRLKPGRRLILGGVHIPYEAGLDGHSDADVLLHAVIDSMLGAVGLADIGTLFPDTDERHRNADSLKLLAEAGRLVAESGFCVGNIDVTLIAQSPRLAPYRDEMRRNIAEILQTGLRRINVKFTTEEGLGFTGRGEGIAAMAVCLLEAVEL